MPRYVSAAPRADDDLYYQPRTWVSEANVQAPENRPVETGLLDARGNKILRISPPIGFGRMEEW